MAKPDLLLLRKHALALAICLLVGIGLYYGTEYFRQRAQAAVAFAQGMYDQTSTSLTQIAQEEATIIRYIDSYRDMVTYGMVDEPDRLQMLEYIGALRGEYSLFAVAVDMSEQITTSLAYDPYDPNPGEPVSLVSTRISLTLPLLHEEDLLILVSRMLTLGALVVPQHCELKVDGGASPDFSSLREHLQASCVLQWFTFDLNPEVVVDEN